MTNTTDSITLAQLSVDTDEPADSLREWHDLGLLPGDPEAFPVAHRERVRLIQFARDRGMSPGALAAIDKEQGLLDLFVDVGIGSRRPGSYSLKEVAERVGIEPGAFERFWTASGLRDQSRVYEDDLQAVTSLLPVFQGGIPEDALLQMLRVLADASDRVAEALNRLFHLHVHESFRAQGKTGRELIEATRAVGEPIQGLVEPAVLYFHRKAWDRALREDFLLHLTEELEAPAAVPGQMVRTILFADLSGFTPLTEAMGDSAAVEVIDRFSDLVREAVAEFRGQVIKQIGDGFMLAFSDPSSAILGGLAIERASSSEPQFPAVRSGAHTGMVIYREADYLGATVNTAARVAAAARGHQLLVTEAVRRQAEDLSDVEFSALGRHELKGVPEPVDLFLVQPEEEPRKRVIDPVCGMELDPDRAAAELVWEGQRLWFCSQGCLQRFTKAPERYARSQSTEIGQVERG